MSIFTAFHVFFLRSWN